MDFGQFEFKLDQPLVPASVMCGKYRPAPVLCLLGINLNGMARLFTVTGLQQAYLPTPLTSLVYLFF